MLLDTLTRLELWCFYWSGFIGVFVDYFLAGRRWCLSKPYDLSRNPSTLPQLFPI